MIEMVITIIGALNGLFSISNIASYYLKLPVYISILIASVSLCVIFIHMSQMGAS